MAQDDMGTLAQDCYGYACPGDPLYEAEFGLGGEPRVRPGPVRTTTIRPRVDPEEEARKEELRKRFVVGEQGGKAPNAVSEKEFAKIAALYEHIWDGDSDLSIDTAGLGAHDAERYKNQVMENMSRLLQTPMGRKQLEYLTNGYMRDGKAVHHKTTIKPGEDRNRNGSPLDDYAAEANPTDLEGASFVTEGRDDQKRIVGKGKGSDSVVEFNMPDDDQSGFKRSDVTLAHELTHSLTQIMGIEDQSYVDFSDGVPRDVDGRRPIRRVEHQAAGLGKYQTGPLSDLHINERVYVEQRNALGQGTSVDAWGEVAPRDSDGVHIRGDDELRARASYR